MIELKNTADMKSGAVLFQEYKKCNALQRRIMNVLSLCYHLTESYELTEIACDHTYSPEELLAEMPDLREKGLIYLLYGKYLISETVREMISEKFLTEKRFSKFAQKIRDVLSNKNFTYEHRIREFRIALYTNDNQKIDFYFDELYRGDKRRGEVPFTTAVFNTPFSEKRIHFLTTAEMRLKVLEAVIEYELCYGNGNSDEKLIKMYLNACAVQSEGSNLLTSIVIMTKLNGGHVSEKVLLKIITADLLVHAVDKLIAGDLETADDNFSKAVDTLQAQSYFKFFPDFSILFYVVSLIKKGNKEEVRTLYENISDFNKFHEPVTISGSLKPLSEICRAFIGDISFCEISEYSLAPLGAQSVYGVFVRLLCCYWLDDPDFKNKLKEVKAAFKGKSVASFYSEQLDLMKNGKGIASLIEPIERWQGALNGIMNWLKPDPENEQRSERLLWLLENRGDDIDFIPVIQKIGKNGRWTQGRQVKVNDLKYKIKNLQLSKNDEEILAIAIRKTEWSWKSGVNQFDERKHLIELALEHPHLLNADNRGSVSLIVEPIKMVSTRKGKSIVLSINPVVSSDTGIRITENKNIWSVAFATKEQVQLGKYIGESIKIPVKEAAKVAALFEVVADKITIEGETETLGKGLSVVDGFTAPNLFIEPYNEGLIFRLRSVPSDDNQRFIPGSGKDEFVGSRNDESVVIKRDLNSEKGIASELVDSVALLAENDNGEFSWALPEPLEALEVLEQLKESSLEPILNWPKGETLKIAGSVSSSDLFQSVKHKNDWFELSGEIEIDKSQVFTLKQLMALAENSESRFVKMSNGEYLALSRSLKQELDALSTYCQKTRGEKIKLHPLAMIPLEDSFIAREFGDSREWIEQFKTNHSKRFRIPKAVRLELRDYQQDGFKWLMRLAESEAGGLLADDMGLGKTVQAIVMLAARQKQGPALIVVPASLSFNWADEITRFAPSLNPILLAGSDREKQIKKLKAGDVLITSYGLVQRNETIFTGRDWQTLILDEAQAVKNSTTKRAKIIKRIPSKFTLITTGTPVENHLGELWNLFDIILPGFLGSAQSFSEKFRIPIEKNENRTVRNRLKRLISPFILRRTKEQVLTELPPKTEINLTVEMGSDEQAFYEAVRQRAVERIEDSGADNDARFTVLSEITRLRQACCHPKLIDKKSTLSSAKLELFGEKVEELIEGDHQGLVFSQFVGHLKLIAEHLDSKNIPYFFLDGSTPAKDRGKLVKAFQAGEKPVFLISLKAGGSGLNLTGADYVFHMDPWWNPAVEDQASDRAHRIGQERPVTVYRLITAGSIEEQIISLHKDKRGLAESLLSDSATSLKLNTNELINIISGR